MYHVIDIWSKVLAREKVEEGKNLRLCVCFEGLKTKLLVSILLLSFILRLL